jgi:hypothetical protein
MPMITPIADRPPRSGRVRTPRASELRGGDELSRVLSRKTDLVGDDLGVVGHALDARLHRAVPELEQGVGGPGSPSFGFPTEPQLTSWTRRTRGSRACGCGETDPLPAHLVAQVEGKLARMNAFDRASV